MEAVLKIDPSRQGNHVLNKNKADIVIQQIFEKNQGSSNNDMKLFIPIPFRVKSIFWDHTSN